MHRRTFLKSAAAVCAVLIVPLSGCRPERKPRRQMVVSIWRNKTGCEPDIHYTVFEDQNETFKHTVEYATVAEGLFHAKNTAYFHDVEEIIVDQRYLGHYFYDYLRVNQPYEHMLQGRKIVLI